MPRVDFISNLAPHYREKLWLTLLKHSASEIRFVFGDNPKTSIEQINFEGAEWREFTDRLTRLRNMSFRHALIWQKGAIGIAAFTDAKIAVILGDMYVISNWIATFILKARGVKVVFWGHGFFVLHFFALRIGILFTESVPRNYS